MVHDMEPPVQGIARRASKILSAQDYYGKVMLKYKEMFLLKQKS